MAEQKETDVVYVEPRLNFKNYIRKLLGKEIFDEGIVKKMNEIGGG